MSFYIDNNIVNNLLLIRSVDSTLVGLVQAKTFLENPSVLSRHNIWTAIIAISGFKIHSNKRIWYNCEFENDI